MAGEKRQILIESILGGQSRTTHFASSGEFRASLGIDPAMPTSEDEAGGSIDKFASRSSGLLRPTGPLDVSSGAFASSNQMIKWIVTEPKNGVVYVYDAQGSVYSYSPGGGFSAVSDGGSMANATGNGAAYYDNYVYFAKDTTVARYGPLNGTPAFDGNYWSGTLGLTPLSNTTYPYNYKITSSTTQYQNHVMHRHSNGRLYFADVIGGQGSIHYISTTKTTVEGDTNNNSTYNALDLPFGFLPTAMESYGDDLVIAMVESGTFQATNNDSARSRAKIAFWDTLSQSYNSITNDEFPDQFIGAMKNVNGVLYVVSGNVAAKGFRVSRYIGGLSFEEVAYVEDATVPYPSAVDGQGTQLLFGSFTSIPEDAGCVYSLGLHNDISSGLFVTQRATGPSSAGDCVVSALKLYHPSSLGYRSPIVGFVRASGADGGLDVIPAYGDQHYSDTNPSFFWSQMFPIGQPFKVTKVRIPMAQGISSSMIVTPSIYVDEGSTSYVGGSAAGIPIINNTTYSGKKNVVFRPENAVGEHNFWLELKWTGTVLCTVGLPITIEYELLED